MALFGLAPEVMKPTALVLNLVVATVGTIRYARAGCFAWNVFWPFAVLSVPLAFVGGWVKLSVQTYKIILGVVLLFAAWRLAFRLSATRDASTAERDRSPVAAPTNTVNREKPSVGQNVEAAAGWDRPRSETKPIPLVRALLLGAAIGLLSGLTGVGGGIFLSPLLLFLGWADVRKTAGVSVTFILVNSASGLLGHLASVKNVPDEIVWWAPAALIGGLIGSELGSRRLAPMTMRRLLAVVLVVAGMKMLMTK